MAALYNHLAETENVYAWHARCSLQRSTLGGRYNRIEPVLRPCDCHQVAALLFKAGICTTNGTQGSRVEKG